jgi:hypothetical protein
MSPRGYLVAGQRPFHYPSCGRVRRPVHGEEEREEAHDFIGYLAYLPKKVKEEGTVAQLLVMAGWSGRGGDI